MSTEYHDDDLLRVDEIVRPPKGKRDPAHKPLLPLSRTAFLTGVKLGILPQPIRFGVRGVYWRVSDLRRVRDQGVALGDDA
jgi:hypothetical protein